ncbi:unnamed protein product [Discula destructiva]
MYEAIKLSLLAITAFGGLAHAAIPNVIITAYRYDTDTNTTMRAFLGQATTDTGALDQVSTLYLTSLTNAEIALDTIICTPYKDAEASVRGGLPFFEGSPAYLSTNEVVVGSIYCSSTALSYDC